ncbi:MAG: PQQ-dependent sugar dehydrogenase [Candidatus Eisenbacteria bacterium]|nr:PQQ-dependent sugar dehydrogenase [Candidatus Eisenbacteria bacterium]
MSFSLTARTRALPTWTITLAVVLLVTGAVAAPPDTPLITEPAVDGQQVNASDVHMETGAFSDPDPGDSHQCTDWEIWTTSPSARVWATICIGGVERLHTHLGDGIFEGSHAGRTSLFFSTQYELRVRHRDQNGDYSADATRSFQTGPASETFPLLLDDVVAAPTPSWIDEGDQPLELPDGAVPGSIFVESPGGDLLLELRGQAGSGNLVVNPSPIAEHIPVRVRMTGGSSTLLLPASRLDFTDDTGTDRSLYLPQMNLGGGETLHLWISSTGASYYGSSGQTEPDFSLLAAGPPVPWLALQPGYKVEVVATGFQLPVNIAFVPSPAPAPDAPLYYVSELYGTIKVVLRDGTVADYATNLLNFDPGGAFPGSGEQGLTGICVDPLNGDLFATLLYDSAPPGGAHYPRVIRLQSVDGGRTASSQSTVLDMFGESQGQSHQISHVSIGPDGKLYVHMGDGFDCGRALDLNSFRGKVLRLNRDGTAPTDNPFFNAGNGITATDYIFAYGFRNPFGGAWRASDGAHYEVENGPDVNDRFAKVTRGANYGWNCSSGSMTTNAIYNWVVPHAPVNLAFIESGQFGGSGFPADKFDHAFVTESGPTWADGPQAQGKRIVEFVLSGTGGLLSGPTPLVEYVGTGKATAVGLAAGPDGLYFSDLYKDAGFTSPVDAGANILRVKFVGTADFSADLAFGYPPHYVQFTDLSNVPGATSWSWSFGDGETSSLPSPQHVYAAPGLYDVRLEVAGPSGVAVKQKNGYIAVGDQPIGVQARYWSNLNFTGTSVERIDPTIDFDWGGGSPDPLIGNDTWSARWSGFVQADFSEPYTFHVVADDGVRLWIDDQLLVDAWVDQPPTEYTATIPLISGQRHLLRMEFYENGGGAMARLYWESPSVPLAIVPRDHLYPGLVAGQPGYPDGFPGTGPVRFARAIANPIAQPTDIVFQAPIGTRVRLALHDAAGRRVSELYDGPIPTPIRAFRLDPHRFPSGVYFLQLGSRAGSASRKVVLLR